MVGTPDDAIAWIEQKQEETGGFGGIMLTAHEWTNFDKIRTPSLRRSVEALLAASFAQRATWSWPNR